ncbi:hypothetical protein C8Q73DRAFT_787061 [Cubamyces lactineus]|nr:hypothetical protein C8Q73DRAFT_787061 [Cubamyces lactineus]
MQLTVSSTPPTSPASSPTPLEHQMSSRSSFLAPTGPYYVVLGNRIPEIHEEIRPPNMALGKFRPLLPIVVCCSLLSDAEAINKLNNELFLRVDRDDAATMMRWIEWEDGPVVRLNPKTPPPYYAIRYGKETGIWVGFEWSSISHLIDVPDNQRSFKKFDTLWESLSYMIHKDGYNLPLRARGGKLSAPTEPLKPLGWRAQSSSIAGESTSASCARPERPASPVKSSRSTSPVKAARSASPVKHSGKHVTITLPHAASTLPFTSTPTPSPSRSSVPRGILRHAVSVDTDSEYEDARADSPSPSEDLNLARLSLRESLTSDALIGALRSLIRPPPTMARDGGAFPVDLGPTANAVLTTIGASAQDSWVVLQVYIHASSPNSFAAQMKDLLGWRRRDSLTLWHAIELPRF